MHFVEAKSLLTRWNGMNIYRGCSHGCVYCDSRSDCYQFKHLFEDADRLFAGHNPKNTAFKRVLEKLGFQYTGDEYYEPTGLYHPSYILKNGNIKSETVM